MTLHDLLERKKSCRRCQLWTTRKRVVVPRCPQVELEGRIAFIGRNPGRDEDAEGEPFVGIAGQELNHWFDYLGWERSDCVVENVVACFTPDNRDPTIDEIVACRQWLDEEMNLLRPRLIVALGATAALAIGASGEHGELVRSQYGLAYLLWHPSYLCRSKHAPRIQKALENDLDGLKSVLKNQERIAAIKKEYGR